MIQPPIGWARFSLVAAILLASVPCTTAELALAAEPSTPMVVLVVDYGDGVLKQFSSLPWKEGTTVFDALQAAAAHRRGIRVVHRGAGERLFVSQIDDRVNEGGNGRNWRFSVNGKKGDRSAGIVAIQAGDRILWEFGP